jgi:HlyD family secretion protein
MNRLYFKWILIATAVSLLLILYSMFSNSQITNDKSQIHYNPHPNLPFQSYISAVGVIEASSNNISIGTSVNRIVDKVFVTAGSKIRKGEPLFQLEDQDLQADLLSRDIAYKIALAKLEKLEALPRQEDLSSAEANMKKAEIEFNEAKSQYKRVQGLQDSRALSQQEINRRKYSYEQAEARFDQAKANLNKVEEGTWKPDIEIAQLEALQAKANIERIKADIERTVIRSPINGIVLQIKIHEGELPSNVNAKGPLMVVGDTDEMYLKVSINQFEAPYFRKESPAVAYLRGNTQLEFPIQFVSLEPFLVNKQNFTNDITDKVDTRVLQVIYKMMKEDQNLFVGQQMDVFIKAEFPK